MAWVLDDLVPGLDDRATDGVGFDARPGYRHTPAVEIYLDAPVTRHLSELLADGEHAVRARHPRDDVLAGLGRFGHQQSYTGRGICDQGSNSGFRAEWSCYQRSRAVRL